ncbi:bifunctional ornithine acetyltransferase/N-acetylglutamate synthase [Methanothermococcus sp. SCGC AD-155-M21]|nr:bifunctional ornithine acetyltransferase/N-acetylglutamate synthase [Methanothermococcus sp. SCGC AD-155-M21]
MGENMDFKIINNGVISPKGFMANGYRNGKYGVGIIYSKRDCIAAGTFTTNKVVAHPVKLSKEILKKNRDNIRAIVVNSGNANCFTKDGYNDGKEMIKKTAEFLNIPEDSVLVASTGVIGRKMPMDIITQGIEKTHNMLKKEGNNNNFANSILTTDRFPKTIAIEFQVNGKKVRIGATAKGAGMIAPNMLHATMLSFITTDIEINPNDLKNSLQKSVDISFNNTIVDGDTSTNDTVFILANGESGIKYEECSNLFDKALAHICRELSKMIVMDGEGSKKIMEVLVKGCTSKEDAIKASKSVVRSLLVKTALYGEDPNWGRIAAAVGYSGADMDMGTMDIIISDYRREVYLVKGGNPIDNEADEDFKLARDIMKGDKIKITIDLKKGNYENIAYGCDLGHDYVKLNSEYTT